MAKICVSGFKISEIDQKALDHYLAVTPRQWAETALKGMINKAIKTIMRDWYEKYKARIEGNVSTDLAVIIPAILAMPGFVSYHVPSPSIPIISRKIAITQEIWGNGLDLEDYELAALNAFYENPENQLRFFMENKIALRRQAMVNELETKLRNNPKATELPAHADDLIAQETAKSSYKNRHQEDEKRDTTSLA